MYKEKNSLLKAAYWKDAAKNFTDLRMLTMAALFAALRIAVKSLRIPLAAGLAITFDCYVNSVGSFIYGPLVALAVGAISDTVGAILFPSGTYFLPFILVEMLSSFIFALFLWKREFSIIRIILSKFTVNFVCNIILTSVFMKWYFAFFNIESSYSIINLMRIFKNLVLFPFEGVLISIFIASLIPAFKSLKLIDSSYQNQKITKKHILLILLLTLISVALVVIYIFIK